MMDRPPALTPDQEIEMACRAVIQDGPRLAGGQQVGAVVRMLRGLGWTPVWDGATASHRGHPSRLRREERVWNRHERRDEVTMVQTVSIGYLRGRLADLRSRRCPACGHLPPMVVPGPLAPGPPG